MTRREGESHEEHLERMKGFHVSDPQIEENRVTAEAALQAASAAWHGDGDTPKDTFYKQAAVDESDARRAVDKRSRWRAAAAYLFLVALTFLGFVRSEAVDARICANSNEARAGITDFLDQLAARDGKITENEREALAIAKTSFDQKECPPPPFDWLPGID